MTSFTKIEPRVLELSFENHQPIRVQQAHYIQYSQVLVQSHPTQDIYQISVQTMFHKNSTKASRVLLRKPSVTEGWTDELSGGS
jgi:hypothetical protein